MTSYKFHRVTNRKNQHLTLLARFGIFSQSPKLAWLMLQIYKPVSEQTYAGKVRFSLGVLDSQKGEVMIRRMAAVLAFGALTLVLIPIAHAEDWGDAANNREAIQEQHENIHHDKRELKNDIREGDRGAARHELGEMHQRHEDIEERRENQSNERRFNGYEENNPSYGYSRHGDKDDDR